MRSSIFFGKYALSLHKEGRIYLLKQHSQFPVLQQLEHFQPRQQVLVDGEAQLLSACLVTATALLESELQFGICHTQHLICSAFTHTNLFILAKQKWIHTRRSTDNLLALVSLLAFT